ncbi:MerR family transcriptional regulator [Streptomyces sp. NPDC017448]|uniref:MerR family transcriptional regulator n=1 Tax=Streptomyces sp. NPDC017448 TaxID=3364996 RepID=UPI0037B98BBC
MDWERNFSTLAEEYYPGSSKKIGRPRSEPPLRTPENDWSSSPRIYSVDGVDYEFFSIGDLAAALNRRPGTIRLWERQGHIPRGMRSPSSHTDKRQRIYTRPQVEGIRRIAEETGILHEARPRIEQTNFRSLVLDLFLALARQPLNGAVPATPEEAP